LAPALLQVVFLFNLLHQDLILFLPAWFLAEVEAEIKIILTLEMVAA
jgi:hypothetical protein